MKIKQTTSLNGTTTVQRYMSLPDALLYPERRLAEMNADAERANLTFRYHEVSDREYYAVRGARAWLLTEPGDVEEDNLMRIAAHKAGMVKDPGEINVIRTDGLSDDVVELVTATALISINTNTCEINEALTIAEDRRFY